MDVSLFFFFLQCNDATFQEVKLLLDSYLSPSLTMETACYFYEQSQYLNANKIFESCSEYIREHIEEILNSAYTFIMILQTLI